MQQVPKIYARPPLAFSKKQIDKMPNETITTRLGNKKAVADWILKVMMFRPHKNYIEPFCGALGLFMSKPLAQYNYLNDFDQDIRNLYETLINFCPKDEHGLPNLDKFHEHPLYKAVELLIFDHQGVWNDEKKYGVKNTRSKTLLSAPQSFCFSQIMVIWVRQKLYEGDKITINKPFWIVCTLSFRYLPKAMFRSLRKIA